MIDGCSDDTQITSKAIYSTEIRLQLPYLLLGLAYKAKPESKNASGLVAKWGVMVPGVPRGERGN